jgi:hypothetical protein
MYFYVLLYYCHRANTQLQLNKYIYIYLLLFGSYGLVIVGHPL